MNVRTLGCWLKTSAGFNSLLIRDQVLCLSAASDIVVVLVDALLSMI